MTGRQANSCRTPTSKHVALTCTVASSRIGEAIRGAISIDDFCGLPPIANIDMALAEARRTLGAQEQAQVVQTTGVFETIGLPLPGVPAIERGSAPRSGQPRCDGPKSVFRRSRRAQQSAVAQIAGQG